MSEEFLNVMCAVVNKMLSGRSINEIGYHLVQHGITSIPKVMDIRGKSSAWHVIATSSSAGELSPECTYRYMYTTYQLLLQMMMG